MRIHYLHMPHISDYSYTPRRVFLIPIFPACTIPICTLTAPCYVSITLASVTALFPPVILQLTHPILILPFFISSLACARGSVMLATCVPAKLLKNLHFMYTPCSRHSSLLIRDLTSSPKPLRLCPLFPR